MHYDGPGEVPGSTGAGYGYEERTYGMNSSDAQEVAA